MIIVFSCAKCGRKFEKDESLAGKKARCKDCGHVFVIPTPTRRPVPALQPVSAGNRAGLPSSGQRRPSLSGPAPASGPMDAIDDPYGLDDGPVSKPGPEPDFASDVIADDEIALPRRFAPSSPLPTKKHSSGSGSECGFFDGLPGIVYLVILGALGFGFLLTLASPSIGAYVFLGTGVLSFLVLFVYGFLGVVIIPFSDGVLTGILCWICPPFLLGYLFKDWDRMKGPFLSYIASIGVIILMAIALPGLNAMRHDLPEPAGNAAAATGPPVPGIGPPAGPGSPADPPNPAPFPSGAAPGFGPPSGAQPPIMSNSITLIVSGLNNREAGKAFRDQLTALARRVSDGFQLSGSGGGGRSMYTLATRNAVDVKAFANQITWAKVTRVAGPTIEVDASAQ